MERRRVRALSSGLALVSVMLAGGVAVSACGSSPSKQPGVEVVVSFYPLQFAAEQIGGAHVSVRNLTKPGAEPHDLELTARDVAAVTRADLVVYLGGFQAAVDDAVQQQGGGHSVDVATAARLEGVAPAEEGRPRGSGPDPHFWLDPTRLADVGDLIAQRLGSADPPHAGDYTAGAARLRGRLASLDHDLAAGLAGCTNKQLVTSHQAFGYLAERYGLRQVGIAGLSPDQEPDADALGRVADLVRHQHVRTVYSETLVSPKIAQTVAAETGARSAVLDPIEGLTSQSAGRNYLDVMRSDLATLKAGQPCS